MVIKEAVMVTIFEGLLPDLKIRPVKNASHKEGKRLEGEGKWGQALQQFYTVATTETNKNIRVDAWIEAAQMCINYGRLRQARKYLSEATTLTGKPVDSEAYYLVARTYEKSAWIDDYEGRFDSSLDHLNWARQTLGLVPTENKGEKEHDLESTINHFSARAHVGLAAQGVDKSENLRRAREILDFEIKGNIPPDNKGHQYAWLTRVAIMEGQLDHAEHNLAEARKLWGVEQRGILAHYYLLAGAIEMAKGHAEFARHGFEQALYIRTVVEEYPKGKAEALAGIATTYWSEGNVGAAVVYAARSIKTFPLIIFRGGA